MVWAVAAAVLAGAALVFAFRHVDPSRLGQILGAGEWRWLLVLAMAVPAEQVLRGWKWRQILFDIRPVATIRLFGAVMAGYFVNMVLPLGISPLVRSWLVARWTGLALATVLLTTAVERFVDGVVFALLVIAVFLFAALPETGGGLRLALAVAGGGSLLLFGGLFVLLFGAKSRLADPESLIRRAVGWVEGRFAGRLAGLGDGISGGIVWPRGRWRGGGVVAASVAMKSIAATYFLWAGLSVGVLLYPFEYLFLLVFSGFAMIMSRFVRMPGGFLVGAAFALKLLGVADEEALSMVAMVFAATATMTVAIGAPVFWRSGLGLGGLRRSGRSDPD